MKKSKTLVLVAVLVALIASGWRVYSLNEKWPEVAVHKAAPGEVLNIEGLDYSIERSELHSQEEITQKYGGYVPFQGFPAEDVYEAIIRLNVHNPGSEPRTVLWPRLVLRSGSWYNGVDLELLRIIHPELTVDTVVAAGDSLTIDFPVLFLRERFEPNYSFDLSTKQFSLDMLRYPEYYQLFIPSFEA